MQRSEIREILSRLCAAGQLPESGTVSVFLRGRSVQLSVSCEKERVLVRQSRLPFFPKTGFSRRELEAAP